MIDMREHLYHLASLGGGITLLLSSAVSSAPPGNEGTIPGQRVPADSAGKVVPFHRASGKTFSGKVDSQIGSFSIGPFPFKGIHACRIDFATS
ncbi:MAG TPA: hypothetical protein DCE55_21860 [Planctomycetaceae bacterium]|nr:hypothetical protein [Planctomycetaceae bacterium]